MQPKSPSAEEWMKLWSIYTVEYYSASKKNEIPLVATRMDLEGDTEWSQAESKHVIWCPLCVGSANKRRQCTHLQNRERLTNLENGLKVRGKEGWEKGIIRGFAKVMCTLLYLNGCQQGPVVQHTELCYVPVQLGGVWKEWTHVRAWPDPSLLTWNDCNIVNWLCPHTKQKV